jgi:hypothetical protein
LPVIAIFALGNPIPEITNPHAPHHRVIGAREHPGYRQKHPAGVTHLDSKISHRAVAVHFEVLDQRPFRRQKG